MTDDMRAEFEKWKHGDELRGEWSFAAFIAGYQAGLHAGMERAAKVCEGLRFHNTKLSAATDSCAEAIRKEMEGDAAPKPTGAFQDVHNRLKASEDKNRKIVERAIRNEIEGGDA